MIGEETEVDAFPTFYPMNTIAVVRKTMEAAEMSSATLLVGAVHERMVNRFDCPRRIRAIIPGSFRKPRSDGTGV